MAYCHKTIVADMARARELADELETLMETAFITPDKLTAAAASA